MGRRRTGDVVNGWINLDKPVGITSTQAIGKVRRYLNASKVGHAGTLDPLASGILPIALGEATKTIPFVQDEVKTYFFTIRWGEQRTTDDAEGDVIASSANRPTPDSVVQILPQYIGEIEQLPPQFSALKIDGKRAYDLARSGEDVKLQTRLVHIESFDMLAMREEEADFRVMCSKGTYIRALARDIALDLETRGYVSALRRESVGTFSLDHAISLDKLEQMGHIAAIGEALMPVDSVLDVIPALSLTTQEKALLKNGQRLSFVSKSDFHRLDTILDDSQNSVLALARCEGNPVGLIKVQGSLVKPVRIFNL